MILNLHSLAFNTFTTSGGGNPAWGTEMGQGEGYRFSFEDAEEFITGLVYKSLPNPKERIVCPLGKGGKQADNYEFVLGSLFEKVFVNGHKVNGKFLLLVTKKLVGENHVGRRTLKYNPNMRLDGINFNAACFQSMAKTIGVSDTGSWFVSQINVRNQDELHFTAHILDANEPTTFKDSNDRTKQLQEKILKYAEENEDKSLLKFFTSSSYSHHSYLRAMRAKPFLLLAGISGTGKSRIVKQLAFDSCPNVGDLQSDPTSPGNYCLIEVKPNWHDSSELLGYESRIGCEHYQLTPFVKFLAKAMLHPSVPFFVCLDEMNLAPVEQYFAEFLSVLENRTKLPSGHIVSEPLVKADIFRKYDPELMYELFSLKKDDAGYGDTATTVDPAAIYGKERDAYDELKAYGLRIPENLIVIGTVNMDETTHQFSRKVIDRAMTIEMNLPDGDPFMDFYSSGSELTYREPAADASLFLPTQTKAGAAIADLANPAAGGDADRAEWLKRAVADFLTSLNDTLKGTPFKVAYRVQNELVLYFYEMWRDDQSAQWEDILTAACDQILMMKVLPRIEGDGELLDKPLESLARFCEPYAAAAKKIAEMRERLDRSQFTSFWP